jgi:hypothetical protein
MYRVIAGYVAKLPGAVKEGARLYSTHSLRATTATLLLDAGVESARTARSPPHHHHPDLRQTPAHDQRKRVS